MEEKRSKSKLIIGLVLIVVGGALLIWTLTGKKAEAPAGESTTDTSVNTQGSVDNGDEPVSNEQPTSATIVFTNDGFSPQELEVKVGTVVTVRNESSTRVQFSSDDHPTHLENQGMNLRVLNPGESASFTADKVGTWGFHDHIDDSMTGTLVVTED